MAPTELPTEPPSTSAYTSTTELNPSKRSAAALESNRLLCISVHESTMHVTSRLIEAGTHSIEDIRMRMLTHQVENNRLKFDIQQLRNTSAIMEAWYEARMARSQVIRAFEVLEEEDKANEERAKRKGATLPPRGPTKVMVRGKRLVTD